MLHQEALRLTRFATHGITLQHTVPRLIILVHVHANDSGAKKEEHVCCNRGTSNKLCNTLQHVSSSKHLIANCSTLQQLQRNATHYSTRQHTAAYHDLLYNTATHCTWRVTQGSTSWATRRYIRHKHQQMSSIIQHLIGHTPQHVTAPFTYTQIHRCMKVHRNTHSHTKIHQRASTKEAPFR